MIVFLKWNTGNISNTGTHIDKEPLLGLKKFTILVTKTVQTDECWQQKHIEVLNYLVYNNIEWIKKRAHTDQRTELTINKFLL